MKNILIISSALIGLVFTSCRQNDDILSSEDAATLEIIQKQNNHVNSNINQNSGVASSPNTTVQTSFAEVIPPPKR